MSRILTRGHYVPHQEINIFSNEFYSDNKLHLYVSFPIPKAFSDMLIYLFTLICKMVISLFVMLLSFYKINLTMLLHSN